MSSMQSFSSSKSLVMKIHKYHLPVFYVMQLVAICAQLIRTLAECLQFIHGLADEAASC